MALTTSFPQASLAATILASTVGTYVALSPPNPSATSEPSTGDTIRWLNLTSRFTTKFTLTPLGLLALHTSALTYFQPNIPSSILRHGAENALNPDVITWSRATAIPLALILCAGFPLRLVSYASLGKNFTFTLMEPDRLTTTGIYRYVQHPSYTGIMVLLVSNAALLARMDGVLSCWVPPRRYQALRIAYLALAPVGLSMLIFGIWTRVRQEERMLRAQFDVEWETWHAQTARFIPWLL
jgi:protein-S-isoprenylcysteine O-methyltransferase Ste14